MKRTVLIIVSFLISACNTATKEAEKIQNDSLKAGVEYKFENQATLTGTLETLKYTNVDGEWFNTHILILDSAISVESNNSEIAPVDTVKEVQIGFNEQKIPKPEVYLDKRVTLTGTLYSEQTVHDRRPVVMVNAIAVD